MIEVGAVILAAGRATRFGAAPDASKLTATLDGVPLVRHVATLARAAALRPVVVVTGHAAGAVSAALDGMPELLLVHNPDHATGMAGSLRAGLAALPSEAAGAMVLLGDMPRVTRPTLRRMVDAFAAGNAGAVVPRTRGRSGNPVLIGRALFAQLMLLTGDEGARRLLAQPTSRTMVCEVDDPGILADVDTPADLAALDGRTIA